MSQPESQLSREIMEVIRSRGGFCFKVHGGPTMMVGLPDIVGVYRGVSLWLETKLPGQKPTAIQLVRLSQAQDAGGIARVLQSRKEIIRLLDDIETYQKDQ